MPAPTLSSVTFSVFISAPLILAVYASFSKTLTASSVLKCALAVLKNEPKASLKSNAPKPVFRLRFFSSSLIFSAILPLALHYSKGSILALLSAVKIRL